MARGLHSLIPPIEIIDNELILEKLTDNKGSFRPVSRNLDPTKPEEWDKNINQLIAKIIGIDYLNQIESIPSKIVQAPFIQVPIGITEDRLVGSIDVSASLNTGEQVFQPGVLACLLYTSPSPRD